MYVDGLRAALGRARADVVSAIDRQAARNGPGKPSVCACGKTLLNPDDPAVLAKHAPHVQAAAQGKPMSDDDKDGSNALADLQATLRELAEAVRDRLHALDERLAAPERKVSEEGHRWTPMASS
jgi:hypothetical protein